MRQSESFAPSTRPQSPFSALLRPSCSECGSPIRWGRISDLAAHVPAPLRARARELHSFLGDDADAWVCTRPRCSGFGAFESGSSGLMP